MNKLQIETNYLTTSWFPHLHICTSSYLHIITYLYSLNRNKDNAKTLGDQGKYE
jgi:hypothetical protein